MNWAEVATQVLDKDLTWFVGFALVLALGIIGIWVWRQKKNGNGSSQALKDGLQLDDRTSMLEKDVAVIKESLRGLNHWVDQSQTTALRHASEYGEIKARLDELDRRLGQTPPSGSKIIN